MENILSGFHFSRKRDFSSHDDKQLSSIDRGTPMQLSKSEATGFSSKSDISTTMSYGETTNTQGKITELSKSKTSPVAVIGPKIKFKGELTGEEDLVVMGTIEGSIDLKGNHLTIASQGVIKANVSARAITVEGKVEGDIVAVEHIAVKSASNVRGNLKAERVTLEDGAKFRGSIDMDVDGSETSYTPTSTYQSRLDNQE
jgi:cytoskeletal protein CcmA (bactofilin family)